METTAVSSTPATQEAPQQVIVVKEKPRQGFLGSLTVGSFVAMGALTAVLGMINMIAAQRHANERNVVSSTTYCNPEICSEIDGSIQILKGFIAGGLIACAGLLVWKLSTETDSDEIFNNDELPNIK